MLLETPTNEVIQAMRLRTVSLKRDGEYWTEEEKRQLQDMFEAGYGISTIYYPQRRSSIKNPCGCLCDTCSCDLSACPRYKAGETTKEAG